MARQRRIQSKPSASPLNRSCPCHHVIKWYPAVRLTAVARHEATALGQPHDPVENVASVGTLRQHDIARPVLTVADPLQFDNIMMSEKRYHAATRRAKSYTGTSLEGHLNQCDELMRW